MKIIINTDDQATYIRFLPYGRQVARTVVEYGMMIDLDEDDMTVGVEIIDMPDELKGEGLAGIGDGESLLDGSVEGQGSPHPG